MAVYRFIDVLEEKVGSDNLVKVIKTNVWEYYLLHRNLLLAGASTAQFLSGRLLTYGVILKALDKVISSPKATTEYLQEWWEYEFVKSLCEHTKYDSTDYVVTGNPAIIVDYKTALSAIDDFLGKIKKKE